LAGAQLRATLNVVTAVARVSMLILSNKSLLIPALLVLAAVCPANADPADYHRRLDDSADGRVDLHEFQSYLGAGFEARDANGNGILDIDEQPQGARRRPLSRADHLRAIEAVFKRQDRNQDGYLSVSELSQPPQR
jgi:hypothetical protein